jgi:hypothetical protein
LKTESLRTPTTDKEDQFGFLSRHATVEDFDEHQVQNDALECHPCERDQEKIVQGNGEGFTQDLEIRSIVRLQAENQEEFGI